MPVLSTADVAHHQLVGSLYGGGQCMLYVGSGRKIGDVNVIVSAW